MKKNPPRPAATPPREGTGEKDSPPPEGCRNGGVGSPVLKYSEHLIPFAKTLRSHMTLAEILLWKNLNRCQRGVRFNRQKPIGKWIVDFYCKELQLAIEVDGNTHDFKKSDDDARQQQLEALGIRFLRFWDSEVKKDLNSVLKRIDHWIQKNPPRPAATPPVEGTEEKNPPRPAATPPVEGTSRIDSPPLEGCRNGRVGSPAAKTPQQTSPKAKQRSGSALVVVLWLLMIVALIVSSFAFEMQLESRVITMQRKRFRADRLALSGIELAKSMIAFEDKDRPAGEKTMYPDSYRNEAVKIEEGLSVNYTEDLGGGRVQLKIESEKGRRNIKTMSRDEWKLLFDQAGIPNTRWDPMLDCLEDWQDENDEHRLNGAESDDPFYRKRNYQCKNAPVDMVEELLLIKEWGEEVLYGSPEETPEGKAITGIAGQLTTWGDGKINPNSASQGVLSTLPVSDELVEAILEFRLGPDGEAGTADDGITANDFTSMGLDGSLFSLVPEYVKVTSIGEAGGVRSEISCIFKLGEKEPVPLFWLEGKLTE